MRPGIFFLSGRKVMTVLRVSEPTLPPIEELTEALEVIWSNRQFTNQGPFADVLEAELSSRLGHLHSSVVPRGTTALILAMLVSD